MGATENTEDTERRQVDEAGLHVDDEMEPDPSSQLYIPPSLIDELSEPFGNSVHQTRSGL